MIRLVTFLFLITVFTSCKSAEPVDNKPVNDKENIYKNPVVNYNIHNPTIKRQNNDYYKQFATKYSHLLFARFSELEICWHCIYRCNPSDI